MDERLRKRTFRHSLADICKITYIDTHGFTAVELLATSYARPVTKEIARNPAFTDEEFPLN